MRNVFLLLIVCHPLCLAPSVAFALGFGRVDSATLLGQRLNFSTQVSTVSQDALTEACVAAEVTVGDNRLSPDQVRVSLAGAADATQKTLRVTTTVVIDEPIVSVNVTIGCVSRMSRKFVVFADPPVIDLARAPAAEPAAIVAMAPVATPAGDERTAAPTPPSAPTAVAARGGDSEAAAPRRPRPRRAVDTPRPRAAALARPRAVAGSSAAVGSASSRPATAARRSAAAAPAAASAAAAPGPRLKLEAPDALATQALVANPASAPPAPAATAPPASGPAAAPVQVALADDLKRLQAQNHALERSVATLESRLRELEGSRPPNDWIAVLATLASLLALIGVAVLWRRSREGGNAAWWSPAAAVPAQPEPVAPAVALAPDPFVVSRSGDGVVEEDEEDDLSAAATGSFAMTLPGEALPAEPPGAQPRSALSVEELFDLEQQADFFLALGQDEAAIDLLLGHARTSGAASPMPYLKLIEIYRRRDDREGYEATRERFNRRFNTTIAGWDEAASEGRPLDECADLVRPLQSVWPDPAVAVQLIEGWVWRTDDTSPGVDLAAYRDLLFLYTIARDLFDRSGEPDRVDLALPLLEGSSGGSHVAQLMASTIPMRVHEEHGRGLDQGIVPDIDLSQPDDATPTAPVVPVLPVEPAEPASPGFDFKLDSDFVNLTKPADPKT